uniref:Probable xyloglucan galactosyltransferase GT11 n=1 Tax=Tanacetum cinerariifolium TaxID=118510 RepID=A0A6L2KVC8_TANCI|nr:probable xyloglucan galactosyltransferase GT11 [Tanacetum cinerariifolium]
MDQTFRYRAKIWLVLCAFFVCWYFLIHNAKWYTLSSPTTTFHKQETPVEIVDFNTTTLPTSDDENKDPGLVEGEIDWLHDASQLRALEHELEPVLKEFKPKPMNESAIDKRKWNDTMIEKLRTRRSKSRLKTKRSCSGRYIYVHDLPSRFNDDILDDCRAFSKWQNMCSYIGNNGLGRNLGNPQRVFSKYGWYSTNQFMLEVIFRSRMTQYECITKNSSQASAIYVPYYAGLDVSRYLFDGNTTSRDALSLDLAQWLREQPEWNTTYGKNHFLITGRITWDFHRGSDDEEDWGNRLLLLPEIKNMTVLTIEKSPWNNNEFGIPYPTYFHPRTDDDIIDWMNKMTRRRRRQLFCFAGSPRPKMEDSIRDVIINQCVMSGRKCRFLNCSENNIKCDQPLDVMQLFQSSVFCLQPPGDSYTRRSTFDSILAGCIPVFFTPGSAYIQYLWHLPKEFSKYSVLINEDDVKHKNVGIERILSRIPEKKVSQMRNEVIGLIPKIIYADPKAKLEKFRDAFDLSIDGVLQRIGNVTSSTSSYDFDESYIWKYYLFGSVKKHAWDHYFDNSINENVNQEIVDAD